MILFTAKDAQQAAGEAKAAGLNNQRIHYLKCIEEAARSGRTSIYVDDQCYFLTEEDLTWFRGLGYKVDPPIKKYYIPVGTDISTLNIREGMNFYTEYKEGLTNVHSVNTSGMISWG